MSGKLYSDIMDNTITLIELLCHIIHADADVLLVAHCALKLPNKGLRCEAARLPRAPQSQLSEPDHENTHKLAPASNWQLGWGCSIYAIFT